MWQFNQKLSGLKAQQFFFFLSYGVFRSWIQTGTRTACLCSTMSEALAGKTWMLGEVSWLGEIQWQRTKIIWRNPHSQIWRDTLEPHLGCWWNISPFGLCSLTAWCWGSKKHPPKRTRQDYIFYDLTLEVIWCYFHWSHKPTQIQSKGTQNVSVGSIHATL